MGDLPTPSSKVYNRTDLSVYKETQAGRFFGNGTLHVCYTCSKDLMHGTPNGLLLPTVAAKGDFVDPNVKLLTATAGCLVDIPGSLRNNPNTMEFKASGYGLLKEINSKISKQL